MKFKKFFADWCGPCKAVDTLLEQLEKSGAELPELEKIDVDQQRDVAVAHGVRNIPALIKIDENGEEVERLVGMISANDLKQFLGVA